MRDDMGSRLKDIESRTKYMLPRRCYTLIRIDGKAFHTYTKKCERPFDTDLREDMEMTTKALCEHIQGCKLGYTQSDEISLLLTDFDAIETSAWFDGNLQKVVSVVASMTSAYFNRFRAIRAGSPDYVPAVFDARAWTTADPWEAYNTFLWRQKDAMRNSIQMVARHLASYKECHGKNCKHLLEMMEDKGFNYYSYPHNCRLGSFVIKDGDRGWRIDQNSPYLQENRNYFFSQIPSIPQF